MSAFPLVSVIIPTYNRITHLGQAIESVLAQTYPFYEIILVDDGSSCDVPQAIEPYHNHVRYVRQENQGLGAARNTGIAHAKGQYLVFLDDDDLLEPRKLEIQTALLEEHPECGFVYSSYYFFETHREAEPQLVIPAERSVAPEQFAEMYFANHDIAISCLFVKRDLITRLGGFDNRFFGNEDVHLWLELGLQSQGVYSDAPSTRIRLHPERMSLDRSIMNESLIRCLEDILRAYPDFCAKLGQHGIHKMSKLHYAYGKALLKKQNLPLARQELLKSIAMAPFLLPQAYVYLLLSRLGRIPVRMVFSSGMRIKRTLREFRNDLGDRQIQEL